MQEGMSDHSSEPTNRTPPRRSGNTEVYECGIVKCYIETDRYHKLCCMKGRLLSIGTF